MAASLKFVYNEQIYKVSSLPESFSALTNLIPVLLKNNLPKAYYLQYQDSEGDRVMLMGEEDYKAMLSTELPKDQAKSMRIFIIEKELPLNASPKDSFVISEAPNTSTNQTSFNLGSFIDGKSDIFDNFSQKTSQLSYEEPTVERQEDSSEEEGAPEEKYNNVDEWKKSKDDFKKQKKILKKEFRHQRRALKEELLKNAITKVLYDNLPNMAKVIGSYIRDPSINLEEAVNNVRPKIEEPEIPPDQGCGPRRHFFKMLLEHYQGLSSDKKSKINAFLGGIPEQLTGRMAEEERNREEWWGRRPPPPFHFGGGPHFPFGGHPRFHFEGERPRKEEFEAKDKGHHKKDERKWNREDDNSSVHSGGKWRNKGKFNKEENTEEFDSRKKGSEKSKQKEEKPVYNIPEYSMQFVKEVGSVPNKVTEKDETIYKTITIKNTGTLEWPKSSLLIPRGEVRSQIVRLTNLKPGAEFSPVLMLKNPGKPGKFVSDWKLGYKDEQGKTIYTNAAIKVDLVVGSSEQNEDDKKKSNENENIKRKAQELKKIFPQIDLDYILEVIGQAPDLSLDELAENYLRT